MTWKEALAGRVPPEMARDIDDFEAELARARQGRSDPAVFTETLRRRGVYGQRYDHGRRHNGVESRAIPYPHLFKGKGIYWDAPGMQRIKLPFGALTCGQMEVIADLAEEYADGIAHVTTRQDIQLHYVHLDDTPDLMRRLAAVGATTQEACGNTVRNVTGCPRAGVCPDEAFDTTPHARAVARYLLGHPDALDFGRKFKISFSGCAEHPCALARMHDIGAVAAVRQVDGETRRGFALWVGGGLGAVPHPAKLLSEFVPERELLPTIQAIVRVHSKYGDKSARNKARMKFLVAKLGIEEFARRVGEERAALPHDPRWDGFLDEALARADGPAHPPGRDPGPSPSPDFLAWRRTNVTPQKQPGYAVVAVTLPLGDLSASQLRALADVARRYVGDNVRLTSEQNLVLRWVRESDLGALYTDLCALGLGQPGAGTIVDITACPGTDTCRLGISSSRGLAAELRTRLLAQNLAFDEAVGGLSIKISGCFNSCGRHHVADLGFYGSSRTLGGHVAPHFMVVLGGTERGNAESFGLPLGSIPSKNIPDVVERITTRFRRERQNGESFQAFAARLGKKELKAMLDDLKELRDFEVSSEPYRDWGDARLFSLDDMMNTEGPGPPAVRRAQLELAAADRLAWQAQLELEAGAYEQVATTAYAAMLAGARALVHLEDGLIEHPDAIVERFRARFVETGLFAANGAGRFAHYLLSRHASPLAQPDAETAREEVHRAQLFLEAAHACYGRLAAASNHLQSAGVP